MQLFKPGSFSKNTFALPLLQWHSQHGRTLPWMTRHPYDVWLSEVMLQQTQVATVLERYASFKACFPTIESLAAASVDDALAQWSGLGYYSRARNLHACAKQLVAWRQIYGDWPKEADQWVAFPGVGKSTAHAIVSACFDKVAPILDANAKRVLLRFAGHVEASNKAAWVYAADAMDIGSSQAASYTQAIMDLGATVCKAKKASCSVCPLMSHCNSVGWEIQKVAPKNKNSRSAKVSKKTVKPVVFFKWALCTRSTVMGMQVLLQQRDQSSFWPALWVFPELDTRFFPSSGASQLIKHELSHRTLRIEVATATFSGALRSNERWVLLSDIAERKIPVPSPVSELANSVG